MNIKELAQSYLGIQAQLEKLEETPTKSKSVQVETRARLRITGRRLAEAVLKETPNEQS